MRFGRKIADRDELFAQRCGVSPGAVILSRQPIDDYVRFRIPDTNCPPLPRPNSPLDDGAADNAEPGRWSFNGKTDYYGPGWQFGPNWDDALNYVSPSYSCYSGDFLTRITVAAGASGTQYPIYYVADHFRFVIQTHNVGIGFGGTLRPAGGNTFAVDVEAITPSGYVSYNLAVILGEPFYLYIRRAGTTISVGWSTTNPNAPDPSTEVDVAHAVTGLVHLALGKDFYIPPSDPPLPPPARITAGVTEWRTIYGGPTQIWVETPVVDVGQPLRVQPRAHPSGLLEWRASNQPFAPADTSPPWNNPQGEYRYWQARLHSTNPSILLERIQFVPAQPSIYPVQLPGFGWRLYHTGAEPPYQPRERALEGVPHSIQISDSVGWQGEGEVIITGDA